ncbi:hypothetical protein LINPERPRIM_LOCUS20795 [Linum perenne]
MRIRGKLNVVWTVLWPPPSGGYLSITLLFTTTRRSGPIIARFVWIFSGSALGFQLHLGLTLDGSRSRVVMILLWRIGLITSW